MNEMQVFNNKEFGGIRVLEIDGVIWFVGRDVADVLKYKEPHKAVLKYVNQEDRIKRPVLTNGGNQSSWVINESGFYKLAFSSQMPKAKEFTSWVTSEVLPSIRKTGGYNVSSGDTVNVIAGQVVQAMMSQMPMIIAETVKATMLALQSGGNFGEERKKGKHMFVKSKFDDLPHEVRNEAVTMMFTKGITCVQVSNSLKEKGFDLSKSSVDRERHRILKDARQVSFFEMNE